MPLLSILVKTKELSILFKKFKMSVRILTGRPLNVVVTVVSFFDVDHKT